MRALEVDSASSCNEEDGDEEEEEVVDLLGRRRSSHRQQERPLPLSNKNRHPWRLCIVLTFCLIIVLYVVAQRPPKISSSSNVLGQELRSEDSKTDAANAVGRQHEDSSSSSEATSSFQLFQCPVQKKMAENIATAPIEHATWYEAVSQRLNFSEYLQSFRDTEFDNWGHSFEEVKQSMYPWKSQRFVQGLKSGDAVYESACGIGMNLYMTLEILQQVADIHNITVYGNEYVPESVDIARAIAAGTREHPTSYLPAGGRLGTICAADSTQLDFVPSNTFDLVYTGYISPLFNPLHLNKSTTDENFAQYTAYCENNAQMAAAAQQRQNDWYAAWVGEMIRIAKPGVPVIVEQVSNP